MRKVSKQEAQSKSSEWGCEYIETSAKTRLNVEECYHKYIIVNSNKYNVFRLLRLIRDRKNANEDHGKRKKKGKCLIL